MFAVRCTLICARPPPSGIARPGRESGDAAGAAAAAAALAAAAGPAAAAAARAGPVAAAAGAGAGAWTNSGAPHCVVVPVLAAGFDDVFESAGYVFDMTTLA